MSENNQLACNAIDSETGRLREVSVDIWEHPELCFEEHHAHKALTGFQVERSYKLPTAFRVTASSAEIPPGSPTIGIDHACGHNLIAILGLAISCGLKKALEEGAIKGKLVVLGCPAEEGGGGKVDLINTGAFADIDVAMMGRPSKFNRSRPLHAAFRSYEHCTNISCHNNFLCLNSLNKQQ